MPAPPTAAWQPSFKDGKVSLEASSTDKSPRTGFAASECSNTGSCRKMGQPQEPSRGHYSDLGTCAVLTS